jgi:processing peptidase subunit alpha
LSCRRSGLPQILNLLADTIYRPLFQDFELEQVRQSIQFELEDLHTRPDPEPLLVEMLHEAAFQNSPLSNPKLCPTDNINRISRQNIYSFMKSLYQPKRTVLTCIGIDHEEFIQMTKEKFNSVVPIWEANPSLLGENQGKNIELETRKSQWVGGAKLIEKDLSDLNQGSHNQLPVIFSKNTFF